MQVQFLGKWHNQNGSELEIEQEDSTGKISGTFRTGVGASGKQSEEFEVTGFVRDDMIAFSVNFGKYDCLTSWAGQFAKHDGEARISSLWHMTINTHGKEKELWRAVWTGADTFAAGPRKSDAPIESEVMLWPSHPTWSGVV